MVIFALPWDLEFETACDVPLTVAVAFDPLDSILQLTLRNESDATVRPRQVTATALLDVPAASGWAWLHGRSASDDTCARVFGAGPLEASGFTAALESGDARTYRSHEQLALTVPVKATPSLLAGSLAMDRFLLDIEVGLDLEETAIERLALVFDIDGVELAPGESLPLQPVLLAEGRDPLAMMDDYADQVAARAAARTPEGPLSGWCSAPAHADQATESTVLANLAAIQSARLPFAFVQVGAGYESHAGDWLSPSDRFPSGIAAVASRIREAGFRPALALSPFLLHERSAALRDNPALALQSPTGGPLLVETPFGRCAILDCTNPTAETWLRHLVSTIVNDWGYDVLTLDALASAARPAHTVAYHAPGVTAAAHQRRGLEIIREAAGEATFLLARDCPFGPALGIVDAMQVAPGLGGHALQLALQRGWMHGRWWLNVPGQLVVHDAGAALDDAEARFRATGIALAGGIVLSGDDLTALSQSRRNLLRTLLPPTGVAARPVNPGAAPVPSVWRADLGGGRSLLGVLNWSDSPAWVVRDEVLAPGEVAFDLWNARVPGMGDVLLRAHEGLLWQVTAHGRGPRLIGDSATLAATGLTVRTVSGQLQVVNALDRPRRIAVEVRGQLLEVDLAPGEGRWFQ